jgi:hypothetical protein
MMQNTQLQNEALTLFNLVTELYQNYFHMLETLIRQTPDSQIDHLQKLYELSREANESLKADLTLFEQAAQQDQESLSKLQEQMQINSIIKKLK